MKLTKERIARGALDLLDEVGLDGLSMRVLATRLDVKAPALYWHVRNKQELLDAMAELIFSESVEGLEAPPRAQPWHIWLAEQAAGMRTALLRYRDGARVFAGTNITHPLMPRVVELTLRTLQDAGFTSAQAARGVTTMLHYTVGFTIEEQARLGTSYGDDSPYAAERMAAAFPAGRFPLANAALGDLFDPDTERSFREGLALIFTGMIQLRDGVPD